MGHEVLYQQIGVKMGFKKGDKVRCVYAGPTIATVSIGKIYTIRSLWQGDWVTTEELGSPTMCLSSWFELLNEESPDIKKEFLPGKRGTITNRAGQKLSGEVLKSQTSFFKFLIDGTVDYSWLRVSEWTIEYEPIKLPEGKYAVIEVGVDSYVAVTGDDNFKWMNLNSGLLTFNSTLKDRLDKGENYRVVFEG